MTEMKMDDEAVFIGPMLPRKEWNQFINKMIKCAEDDDEKGMEALCVLMRRKMERYRYTDFFSFLTSSIRQSW